MDNQEIHIIAAKKKKKFYRKNDNICSKNCLINDEVTRAQTQKRKLEKLSAQAQKRTFFQNFSPQTQKRTCLQIKDKF